MHYSRRSVLTSTAVATALSLAGCTGASESDDESDGTDDQNSGENGGDGQTNAVDRQRREELVNRRVTINEDDYESWTFSLNRDSTLEYEWTVRDGPEVELFVMEQSEYSYFRSGERFHADSSAGTGGRNRIDLSADTEWAFVIDNSEAGSVSPPTNFEDDVAQVEVESSLVS